MGSMLDEPVIPDILCKAGGVTASYFEWVQNTNSYYWTEQDVNDRLEVLMVTAFPEGIQVRGWLDP